MAALIDCNSDTTYDPVELRIHGVEDGGWYWVFRPIGTGTDADVAAAAAPLMRMDLLAQAPRQLPLEPNIGGVQATRHVVTVDSAGRGTGGATLFTDAANKLFDVLPHPTAVLPATPCSGEFLASAATDESCILGTAADWQLTLADADGDALSSAAIVRPATEGSTVSVAATLALATGHLVASDCAPNAEIDLTGGKSGSTDLTLPGGVSISGSNPVAPGTCPAATLSFAWTVQVGTDSSRCASTNADRGTPQTVRVTASTLTGATPALPSDLFAEFQVTCAAASSSPSAGQELVPDGGLPTVE